MKLAKQKLYRPTRTAFSLAIKFEIDHETPQLKRCSQRWLISISKEEKCFSNVKLIFICN